MPLRCKIPWKMETVCEGPEGKVEAKASTEKSGGGGKEAWKRAAEEAKTSNAAADKATTHKAPKFGLSSKHR